ncbi:MAG TPA: tryptophan 7-halogenase, partial [Polyangia bacterium]|nr:tryptophan 7-halogenase [Polyangia bacterium]
EEAIREMHAKNPGMDEPWSLKFRTGRHDHFYKGNVVALGNAYGFVEPLESSALHILNEQLLLFLDHYPYDRRDDGVRDMLNRKAAELWDAWRWFLAVHFKFNRRLDTPYWRECREKGDIGGAGAALESYRREAPIMYGPDRDRLLDGRFYGGFDTLFLGQRVAAEGHRPLLKDREQYMQKVRSCYYLADRALPHGECLRLLSGELGHFLDRQLDHPQSWLVAGARPVEVRFKL